MAPERAILCSEEEEEEEEGYQVSDVSSSSTYLLTSFGDSFFGYPNTRER